MSADEVDINAFRKGVISYLTKPMNSKGLDQAFTKIESMIEGKVKKMLIVEDDEISVRVLFVLSVIPMWKQLQWEPAEKQ